MIIGFDIISDLYLSPTDSFNWEGNPTSLFCIVSGNISNNLDVVQNTLTHLSRIYRGVFFIDGALEVGNPDLKKQRIDQLTKISSNYKNVSYLNTNVIVVDGVAIIGCNGWSGNYWPNSKIDELKASVSRAEDMLYLKSTLEKLQLHLDIKKIIVVTNSVPSLNLYFGENPGILDDIDLTDALVADTESKIVTWVFGNHPNGIDTLIKNIRYVNNGCFSKKPYWPKRIDVSI